jgi:predicted metal-dependent phosphoesterase TrpH
MIDLHLHTTASDGRSTPEALVREAALAGLTTIAVTDHDTTASIAEVTGRAKASSMTCVPGIEITAVHDGQDVHVLGYFLDAANSELAEFLAGQREDRRRRLFEMADKLGRIGMPIDHGRLHAAARDSARAVGRPMLADALVRAGYVTTISEAFERFLGTGKPAFVPRRGASPAEVVELITQAGGLSSLAHPGKSDLDEIIPELVAGGLGAIEVYHPDHDDRQTTHYRELARRYDVLVTGGSDYHGAGSGRTSGFGRVTLPVDDYERLIDRAGWTE